MDFVTAIGGLAGLASVVSFTPQAWKIIRSRETKGLSAGMYAVTVTGFTLWVTYGVLLMNWPVILTNVICLALSAFILTMILLPRRQRNAVADALEPGAK